MEQLRKSHSEIGGRPEKSSGVSEKCPEKSTEARCKPEGKRICAEAQDTEPEIKIGVSE